MTRSTLDSLCELITDGAHKSPKEFPNGIPMMSVKDMTDKSFSYDNCKTISTEDAHELIAGGCRPKIGDVLIAKDGSVLKHVFTVKRPADYVLLSSIAIIRPKKDKLISEYLEYMFKNPQFKSMVLSSFLGGSGVPRIVLRDFKKVIIDVPPLQEQKVIAEVLSSLDDKIELLQKQNETLEALAQTLFRQWFIEEADDVDYSPLGNLVEIIDNRGKTPPWQQEETEYPLIEVNALGERVVDYTKIRKYVDKPTFESWFRGHPSKYATLLSTVGSIGEFSMYLLERGTIAQNVIALEAQGLSKFYLYQVMCYLQKEIKEFNIGSVQPSIKVSHLKNYKIPIPKNKQAISHFDEFSKSICDKMENNQVQIQTLQHTRDSLLPKLMSGQVRVKLD